MTAGVPTSLELYLVRHAVAEERGPKYPNDDLRPLTADGIAKWRKSVEGLRAFDLVLDLVVTSPLTRAQDTAEILAAGLRPRPRVITSDVLAPNGKITEIVAAVTTHSRPAKGASKGASRLALVGHEPGLGELAARLLGARGVVEFKKGAVCRIDVSRAMPGGPGVLRWFLPPRALRDLAR